MEETKICTKCEKERPLSEFYADKRYKDGLISICKICHRKYCARQYIKNREDILARRATRYEQSNNCRLQSHYGITLSDYDEILETQDNKCAICGRTPEENGQRLAVDHDHNTGIIRGLLCVKCNSALGMFNDSLYLLHAATNYLERFK